MKIRFAVFIIALLPALQACQQQKEIQATQVSKKRVARRKHIEIPYTPVIPDSICIAAVGDIMLGTSYPTINTLQPDSGKSSFKHVTAYLQSADVALGNLEGTLLDNGDPADYKLHQRSKAYLFRMPVSNGTILKDAGFKVLSLANNHINDFGQTGRISTTGTLDSCGIHYAGLQEHPSVTFTVKGIKYGFCSFAPNSNTVSIFDLPGAGQIIRDLKQQCDIVIVSFHGGGEGPAFEHVTRAQESYFGEKRGNVYSFAHNAVDNGADLIFGSGPHVSRAMELYKNRLIAYSLGNFCTYKCVSIAGVCGIAPLLRVHVNRKGEFLSGSIISIKQSREKRVEPDTLHRAAKHVKWLTTADFSDNKLSISETGMLTVVK
ncbi:MAG: CapA family protein [Mucilaginibacter sp.]|nr:CapA family protein [Mucilaginibacter sp.]